MDAAGEAGCQVETLAAFVPGSLRLVCGDGTSPEEAFGEVVLIAGSEFHGPSFPHVPMGSLPVVLVPDAISSHVETLVKVIDFVINSYEIDN